MMPADGGDDALQSFLSTYGEQRPEAEADYTHNAAASIPHRSICCCGNPACAYLKQNQASLNDLEQDVRHAAKLGQVCGIILIVERHCFGAFARLFLLEAVNALYAVTGWCCVRA